MSEQLPKIVEKKSVRKELEPDTYYWCACGLSSNQPFCDGSHEGTSFNPVEFKLTEKKNVSLCLCKRTKNSPYCDGEHKTL